MVCAIIIAVLWRRLAPTQSHSPGKSLFDVANPRKTQLTGSVEMERSLRTSTIATVVAGSRRPVAAPRHEDGGWRRPPFVPELARGSECSPKCSPEYRPEYRPEYATVCVGE